MDGVALHWFRNCLRLHDNQALSKATESNSYLIPLYVLDPELLDPELAGANQIGFLLDTLRCLDEDLKEKGSRLFVVKGNPVEVVEKFIGVFHVDTLTFQRDTDPHNRGVDEQVLKMAASHGVRICATWGETLYEMDHLLSLCRGQPPPKQEAFIDMVTTAGPPLCPVDEPKNIPPPPPLPVLCPIHEPDSIPPSLHCPLDELDSIPPYPVESINSPAKLHEHFMSTTSLPQQTTLASVLSPPAACAHLLVAQEVSSIPNPCPLSSPTHFRQSSSSPISMLPTLSITFLPGVIPSPSQSSQTDPHPSLSPKPVHSPPLDPEYSVSTPLSSTLSPATITPPTSNPSPIQSPKMCHPITHINQVIPPQPQSPKIIPPPVLITQVIAPPGILMKNIPHPAILKKPMTPPPMLKQNVLLHSLLSERLATPTLLTQSLPRPRILSESILTQPHPLCASTMNITPSPILFPKEAGTSNTNPISTSASCPCSSLGPNQICPWSSPDNFSPNQPSTQTSTRSPSPEDTPSTDDTTLAVPISTVSQAIAPPEKIISVLTILTRATPTPGPRPEPSPTPSHSSTCSPTSSSPAVTMCPVTLTTRPPSVSEEQYKALGILKEIPTLSDLVEFGYRPEEYTTSFAAGEKEALRLMDLYFEQRHRLHFSCNINDKNTTRKWYDPPESPLSLSTVEEIKLSPYLAWGSLSVRLVYQRFQKKIRTPGMTAKHLLSVICRCLQVASQSLQSRLFAREYAYLIGYSCPKFGPFIGEPTCICMRINWVVGDRATERLRKWESGQTGYPAVDACMNQLRREGWMHDSCRHMVAAFLTGSGLMVYWELGRSVFEKYLLDIDWSINSYQWHWLSCAAFFHGHFKSIDPVTFLKKCDPSGSFVRKYVPVLELFPQEFIYEPWLAPLRVQEAAGCVLGKDYPFPMIDHRTASKSNMDQIRRISEDFLDLN